MTRHMSVTLGVPSTPCTLGQSQFDHLPWPGPIASYSWHGFVFPAVLGDTSLPDALDAALADPDLGPHGRGFMTALRREATPNRLDIIGLGDASFTEPGEAKPPTTVVTAIREYADRLRGQTRP